MVGIAFEKAVNDSDPNALNAIYDPDSDLVQNYIDAVNAGYEPSEEVVEAIQALDTDGNPVIEELVDTVAPEPNILAVAYIDNVDDGGDYDPDVDTLIAAIYDTDEVKGLSAADPTNGVTGDTVVYGSVPLDLTATATAEYTNEEGTISEIIYQSDTYIYVQTDEDTRVSFSGSGLYESYTHQYLQPNNAYGYFASLYDGYENPRTPGSTTNSVRVETIAPTDPQLSTDIRVDETGPEALGDDPFLDVDIITYDV